MSAFFGTGSTTFGAVTTGLVGLLLLVITIVASILFFGFVTSLGASTAAIVTLGKVVLSSTGGIVLKAPVLIGNALIGVTSLTGTVLVNFGGFIAAVGTKLLVIFTDVTGFLANILIFVGNKLLTFATFVGGELAGASVTLLSKIANAFYYAIKLLLDFLFGKILPQIP